MAAVSGFPAYHLAMSPLPLCTSVQTSPAGGSIGGLPLNKERFQRAPVCDEADLASDELAYDLDSRPSSRLCDDEHITLETRGTTSQSPHTPRPPAVKPSQPEFWRTQTTFKNSIAAKIRLAGMTAEAEKLENCHSFYTVAQCSDCGSVRKFPNRCDLFYCPECQPSLARERQFQIAWWTKIIHQPKHVVLTVRNVPDLTREHVQQLRKWFGALRRRKFASNWKGGFYSIECTNEGRGWHLHIHALIEAAWIDAPKLALEWANVTNDSGRIVKVKDCREKSYLAEVTKYAVKGSQLSQWQPAEISRFIQAFRGVRTFGVFGSLYGMRTQFADVVASIREARPKCPCGSCAVKYYSEAQWLCHDLIPNSPLSTRPPPDSQLDLAIERPLAIGPR
jgi:hypothetical protein